MTSTTSWTTGDLAGAHYLALSASDGHHPQIELGMVTVGGSL